MIYLTTDELREKLDISLINNYIIRNGFRYVGRDHHMILTTMPSFEKDIAQYIAEHDLDSETTLAYYNLPLAEEERKAREKEIICKIKRGILDDEYYMQVGYDHNQVIVSFYLNMTVEKLIKILSGKVNLI